MAPLTSEDTQDLLSLAPADQYLTSSCLSSPTLPDPGIQPHSTTQIFSHSAWILFPSQLFAHQRLSSVCHRTLTHLHFNQVMAFNWQHSKPPSCQLINIALGPFIYHQFFMECLIQCQSTCQKIRCQSVILMNLSNIAIYQKLYDHCNPT